MSKIQIWIDAISPMKSKCFNCKTIIKPGEIHRESCYNMDEIDKDSKSLCKKCADEMGIRI